MWISRTHYEDTRLDAMRHSTEAAVLAQQNIALRTTIEWLCMRLTQVEKERGLLVRNYMGITIETPDIRPAPVAREVPTDIPSMLGAALFSDVGDNQARAMGIDWDAEGRVVSSASKG